MAKARNPITLSREFGIERKRLLDLGILDSTLAVDTRLFIDPLLLDRSRHPEISQAATQQYRTHFEKVIRLLVASRMRDDPAWRGALKLFDFPEIPGTCLGYGAGSIHGSAWGPQLRARVFEVAAQIVAIGVTDPDLFSAMAIFEADVGPDRLSDMTTNIIFPALAAFNARALHELELVGSKFTHGSADGAFLVNPYESERTPVILLPTDILRHLPVAHDWDSVADAARRNEELRERVNQHIAEIWERKTKRDKGRLKSEALHSKEAFETLLRTMRAVTARSYDTESDPEGLIQWATKGSDFAAQFPVTLEAPSALTLEAAFEVVVKIVHQFRHLIEHCGLNKELFRSDKEPRHESTAQRIFFAVSYAYCRANNLDISPEIDTGNGRIDFKFSNGFDIRILVEVKLSTNQNVLSGYRTQLEVYKESQETTKAIYLVIDVGRMGRKDKDLMAIRNEAGKLGRPLSDLEFVDGTLKASASKRKR
jgi:hypothetical protein